MQLIRKNARKYRHAKIIAHAYLRTGHYGWYNRRWPVCETIYGMLDMIQIKIYKFRIVLSTIQPKYQHIIS